MKRRQIPHTYITIFHIVLLCIALAWIIPGGQYMENINPDRERAAVYESVESAPQTWEVPSTFYKGFVDKAGIVVFILIIGGVFWIVNDSKAFGIGIVSFLREACKIENNPTPHKVGIDNFLLIAVMLLFSIFGAVLGMSEEAIVFCPVPAPMAMSMGHDSITGVCVVFIAAGLGFAGTILDPFTIGIAQGLAGVPLFSSIEYRIVCWCIISVVDFTWISCYAAKIKKNPQLSSVYEDDQYWRDLHNTHSLEIVYRTPRAIWVSFILLVVILAAFSIYHPQTSLEIGNNVIEGLLLVLILSVAFITSSIFTLRKTVHLYTLNLLFFTIFFLIIGVIGYGWYIMEMATLFFALDIAAGIANGCDPNELVKLFLEGCKDTMSAALVVSLAGGIIVILQEDKVIGTILFNLAKGMEGLGQVATVEMMYVTQMLIDLVIPSGSAKAALTIPIMAPLSELIGLSKQVTVMAFQFDDGFTNPITPTSGVLIAVLGVSRIPYDKWFKWARKFTLVPVILGFLLLIPMVLILMSGF